MSARPALPVLGDLEEAVLEHLWRSGEADVLETHAAVGARRGITPNTVGSALERLHRKGLLARRKVSHAYRYRASLDRETYRAQRLIEAAGGTAALRREGVLAAFVDLLGETDAAALERLEAIVAERRARAKRGGS